MKLPLKIGSVIFLGLLFSVSLSLIVLTLTNTLLPGFSLQAVIIKILIVFLLIICPLSFLIWFILEKIIVQRIESFIKVAHTIASGNFSVRVQESGNDEIADMAKSLNIIISNMVRALQSMANSLRDSIIKQRELDVNVHELSQEKAKDEALLTSIGDGVVAIDVKGNIVFVNTETEKMLGLKEDEIISKPWEEIMTPFDLVKGELKPKEELIIERALVDGNKIHANCIYKRKDNSYFPAAITVSPVMTESKVNGVILVFKDITKETEIDRMKTEFISLASHQLRTPLSAIRWFSELLLENLNGNLKDEDLDLAENINQSTKRMIDLVGSLLNISRIESGRIIIDPKPTNLNELVADTIKELQVKIEEKSHHVNLETAENLPIINVDPKLIRHVYMNLLTNAIKYTPKDGTIKVTIYPDGNEIVSKVSDNGYGIPKKDYHKIFQKFFRADNVVKIETDGSGLGLYLVKSIVESSHGKIWFESEEGKGTTFIFTLPLSGMVAKAGEVTLGS